jgi:O-antigen ligase
MNTKYPWLLPVLLSPLGLIIPLAPRSGPLWVLLIGIAGIVHFIRHRPSLNWLKTPPIYALCAFLAYLFLTGFWSINPERSFEQAFRLTMLALFGLASFSLVRSLGTEQRQRVVNCLLPAIIAGIVTGCIYGLLQYTDPYIRAINDFLGAPVGFSYADWYDNRLHIAKVMLLTNLSFFALLPWIWDKQKLLAVASYAGLLTVCFYSDSQSSLVACVAGGLVFAAFKISPRWTPKIGISFLVAGFITVIPITQSVYFEEKMVKLSNTTLGKEVSPNERLLVYQFFGGVSSEKAILGRGLMSGVQYEDDEQSRDYKGLMRHIRTPHNIHLQVLFDTGFVGAGLLLLFLILPVWNDLKNDHRQKAFVILLPISVLFAGTMFNFVIWRAWILGFATLAILFLFLNSQQFDYRR